MERFLIPLYKKGGIRTKEAVDLLLEQRMTLDAVYRTIAAHHGVSKRQVERSIRNCLLEIWENADDEMRSSLVPWHSRIDPPGNREFLHALAAHIRMERANEKGMLLLHPLVSSS